MPRQQAQQCEIGGIVMDKVSGKLTVFFEDPFWVGVFEHIEDGKLSVAKVTFGAEPRIMRFKSIFKNSVTVCNLVRLWQLL